MGRSRKPDKGSPGRAVGAAVGQAIAADSTSARRTKKQTRKERGKQLYAQYIAPRVDAGIPAWRGPRAPSVTDRAGMFMNCTKARRILLRYYRGGKGNRSVTRSAGVYAAAAVDYVLKEIMEVMQWLPAGFKRFGRIEPRDVLAAIRVDMEMKELMKDVIILFAGAIGREQTAAIVEDEAKITEQILDRRIAESKRFVDVSSRKVELAVKEREVRRRLLSALETTDDLDDNEKETRCNIMGDALAMAKSSQKEKLQKMRRSIKILRYQEQEKNEDVLRLQGILGRKSPVQQREHGRMLRIDWYPCPPMMLREEAMARMQALREEDEEKQKEEAAAAKRAERRRNK